MPDFLLEVGLEEIPARMIAAAQAELARRVEDLLWRNQLRGDAFAIESYSTPRRIAVIAKSIIAGRPDAEEALIGPPWHVAFKNGVPTQAAHAFAKKAGVEIAALDRITDSKGEYVRARVLRKGRTTSELLTEQLPKELASLY